MRGASGVVVMSQVPGCAGLNVPMANSAAYVPGADDRCPQGSLAEGGIVVRVLWGSAKCLSVGQSVLGAVAVHHDNRASGLCADLSGHIHAGSCTFSVV